MRAFEQNLNSRRRQSLKASLRRMRVLPSLIKLWIARALIRDRMKDSDRPVAWAASRTVKVSRLKWFRTGSTLRRTAHLLQQYFCFCEDVVGTKGASHSMHCWTVVPNSKIRFSNLTRHCWQAIAGSYVFIHAAIVVALSRLSALRGQLFAGNVYHRFSRYRLVTEILF